MYKQAKQTLLNCDTIKQFKEVTFTDRYIMHKSMQRNHARSKSSPMIIIETKLPPKFQRDCCKKEDESCAIVSN